MNVLERQLWGDFVEKVEKSSVTKTRQTAIRWNIAAQHHLRPVEDGARCPIDKLAGPPADFLNAALVGLPEIEHRRKGVFQHNRPPAVARNSPSGSALEWRTKIRPCRGFLNTVHWSTTPTRQVMRA